MKLTSSVPSHLFVSNLEAEPHVFGSTVPLWLSLTFRASKEFVFTRLCTPFNAKGVRIILSGETKRSYIIFVIAEYF